MPAQKETLRVRGPLKELVLLPPDACLAPLKCSAHPRACDGSCRCVARGRQRYGAEIWTASKGGPSARVTFAPGK